MDFKIDKIYNIDELDKLKISLLHISDDRYVLVKDNQVYFFERLEERSYRVYDIISKRSFVL